MAGQQGPDPSIPLFGLKINKTAQDDPGKWEDKYAKCDTLLLSLENEDDHGLDFGGGYGNFLISSKDLKELKFKKVLYIFDC
ncbi:MAG TPA: DUF1963 domain-containing protein [Leptospiraceae bacterium]|nr:DUF1963 domain-containing protein [Leptospiraceae bacterium]HMY66670.1 DUF1963 domain-containing protein [Leptospiraceae bacterium]HNF14915.1 DUF1963 domain-containing protein [Leptospiraceae bacterium]HNH08782.1 DUF1963 domain-containing protein [Leptospiraceae bacterium]HNI96520.1 DUF1963 domain-containing protein [Leptospiraceae bacterium]